MKKILILCLFAFSILLLHAQTGLFELSFEDDVETCVQIMAERGFQLEEGDDNSLIYTNADNDLVEYIELIFDEEDLYLIGWTICYNDVDYEDIEELVIDTMIGYHGEDYSWDVALEIYTWQLNDTYMVTAGWDSGYYNFWVEYSYSW